LAETQRSLSVAKSNPVSVETRSRDPRRLYDDNKPIALVGDPKVDLDKKKMIFPAVNAETLLGANKTYESSVDGTEKGISGIAVPIRGPEPVLGALNIVFFTSAMTPRVAAERYQARVPPQWRAAARKLRAGYRRSPSAILAPARPSGR
jgi:hypothetical protein